MLLRGSIRVCYPPTTVGRLIYTFKVGRWSEIVRDNRRAQFHDFLAAHPLSSIATNIFRNNSGFSIKKKQLLILKSLI